MKLEAKDIRPGNCIELFGRVQVKGIYIPEGHTRYHVQTEDWNDIPLYEFKPIPITKDHIKEFGGKKHKNKKRYHIDGWIYLECEDGNCEDPVIDVHLKGTYITCIGYLHELQNLITDLKLI